MSKETKVERVDRAMGYVISIAISSVLILALGRFAWWLLLGT